jgi:hypothetical protein
MQTGLLWYDPEPDRTTVVKVTAAAVCFEEKFGLTPDTCYVNDRSLKDGELTIPFHEGKLRLVPANNVLVDHFWIGQDEG